MWQKYTSAYGHCEVKNQQNKKKNFEKKQQNNFQPDNFEDPVVDDVHLPGNLSLTTDEVPGSEDEGFQVEDQVVEEFRLDQPEYWYLKSVTRLNSFVLTLI